MARGDHHSRGRPEVPNGECEDRGGQRAGEHEGSHSGTLHDRRGVVGKDIGVVPGVVSDDDGALGSEVLGQVASQARGGLKDNDPIHAVGSRTERPPKAGRSEVQASGEAVRQLGIVSLDQSFKFAAGRGVGVLVEPRSSHVVEVHGSVSS